MFTSTTRSYARLFRCTAVVAATAGLSLTGCTGSGTTVPSTAQRAAQSVQFDGAPSPADTARIAAMQGRVNEKLASGYVFKTVGTATSAIRNSSGTSTITVGDGHHLSISLVPKSEGGDRITLDGNRSPQYVSQPGCYDGCGPWGGGGMPTPGPYNPPPNYGDCSGGGGATWWDAGMAIGGCLGPGGPPRGLSCGNYLWSRLGHGRLELLTGDIWDGLNWVSDNGDGTCGVN